MADVIRRRDIFGPDDFSIVVNRRISSSRSFKSHTHEFSELVIIQGGRGVHATAGEEWPLAAGDVFVVNGARPHEYRHMKQLKLAQILFKPEELSMPTCDLGKLPGYHVLFALEPAYRARHRFESRLHLATEELATANGMVDALHDELGKKTAGFKFMATSFFMQLLGFLSRCYTRSRAPASKNLLRIGEAISCIEQNYREEITLEQLAGVAHMSVRNFQRAFREAMGTSPIDYLLRHRITRATEFLRSRNLTVAEVSYRVGFDDSNYFSRKFREIRGESPSTFRKRMVRTAPDPRAVVS